MRFSKLYIGITALEDVNSIFSGFNCADLLIKYMEYADGHLYYQYILYYKISLFGLQHINAIICGFNCIDLLMKYIECADGHCFYLKKFAYMLFEAMLLSTVVN